MKLTSKLFVLALFLVSLTAAAQRKQSVLWQVSGHGLKQPSYLFGTVHILPPSLLDKFPVKQYLGKTQFGVFEGAGSPINPAQPKKSSASERPQRPQPPLDSLFSKRDYAAVDSFFSASPLGSIKEHNHNTDLQALLYAAARIKQNPAAEQRSLDESIAEEMQRMGKPVFSLDAADDPDIQRVLTNYTYLANAIVSLVRAKDRNVLGDDEEDYTAHLSTNLNLGEKTMDTGTNLTVHRNLLWMPQLEQKMREGSCFVAVGVGHLQFKEGLIMLLRQKGYKLKPIMLARNN